MTRIFKKTYAICDTYTAEIELEDSEIEGMTEKEILELADDRKRATLRIVCGKGTYIRSLARDIGMALGSGAYLTDLCRTRVGDVSIEKAMTFDEFHEWFDKIDVTL